MATIGTIPPLRTVREKGAGYKYEDYGSERRALGLVSVATDAWWMATVTVPIADDGVMFIQIERSGPVPPGYRGSGMPPSYPSRLVRWTPFSPSSRASSPTRVARTS
jgi:hypothetical protein